MTQQVPIGEIAEFINGRAFKPSEWVDTGVPIIRIQNLTGSSGEINYYDGAVDEKHLIRDGDILISWSASLGVYIWEGGKAVLNQHIFKVVTGSRVYDQYFYYAIMNVLDEMISQVHGSTMQHITKGRFEAVCIPLPPLDEQKRIAAILEEADHARRTRRFTQSVSDTFLQEVFVEMFGDPVTNPMRWEVRPFSEYIHNLRNGLSPSSDGVVEGRVLILSAITGQYFSSHHVKPANFTQSFSNYLVDKREFLICRGNGNLNLVGAGKFPSVSMLDTVFPDTMIAALIDSRMRPLYLETAWNQPYAREQIESGARTTNGTYKINQQVIGSIRLPVPPEDAQAEFEYIVRDHYTVLQQQYESARQAEHLFQSLLHQAFRGEL